MKKLLLAVLFFNNVFSAVGQNIYVSNDGDDSQNGLSIQTPFKTLERAKIEVNILIDTQSSQNITVHLREGVYELDNTFVLDNSTSGNSVRKVIFKSYENENATISGGVQIMAQWLNLGANIWSANLSSYNLYGFRQLYINGERAVRSKLDNVDYSTIRLDTNNFSNYKLPSTINLTNLNNQGELEIVTRDKWKEIRVPIKQINNNQLDFSDSFSAHAYAKSEVSDGLKNVVIAELGNIVRIENNLSFVDKPGEWYYDKFSEILYYYPLNNENPNSSDVVIPQLEYLIKGNGVNYIEFQDLTFSYATWNEPSVDDGYYHIQADQYADFNLPPDIGSRDFKSTLANIEFRQSSNIIFKNNKFTHLGGVGLRFHTSSIDNIIDNNTFLDISSNAISIGNVWKLTGPSESDVSKNNQIINNSIENVANEYHGSVGVFIGNTQNVLVKNNEIFDLPYSGISVGFFRNNNGSSIVGKHIIENNKIHDVLLELEDGAAIYTLYGNNFGVTKILENEINNIYGSSDKLKCAIYLDELSSNILVKSNYGNPLFPYLNGNNQLEDVHVYNNIVQRGIAEDNVIIEENDFGESSLWINKKSYNPKNLFSFSSDVLGDLGVRFVDVDHDGKKDYIINRYLGQGDNYKFVHLNTGNGWDTINRGDFQVPYHIAVDGIKDIGVRFIDINGDGFDDMLVNRYRNGLPLVNMTFINSGTGWTRHYGYATPYHIADDLIGDLGVRFVDVDHDGLKDILIYRYINSTLSHKLAYLNTGSTWKRSYNASFIPPYHTSADHVDDVGVRFVDINGDNYDDMLVHRVINSNETVKLAYINTGSGWERHYGYAPPYPIASGNIDRGVRFIDINHDGLKDFVVSNTDEKKVYLNNCIGWEEYSESDYNLPPINFVDSNISNNGVKIVDIDGDGFEDIIQKRYLSSNNKIYNYINNRNPIQSSCFNSAQLKFNVTQDNLHNTGAVDSSELIKVFPNPSSETVILQLDLKSEVFVNTTLHKITGEFIRNILSKEFLPEKHDIPIDVESLSTGVYLLVIKLNDIIHTRIIFKN